LEVAILVLDGLIHQTYSPDVVALAIYHAMDKAQAEGMDEEKTRRIMSMLYNHIRGIQKQSPMHRAMWG